MPSPKMLGRRREFSAHVKLGRDDASRITVRRFVNLVMEFGL